MEKKKKVQKKNFNCERATGTRRSSDRDERRKRDAEGIPDGGAGQMLWREEGGVWQ